MSIPAKLTKFGPKKIAATKPIPINYINQESDVDLDNGTSLSKNEVRGTMFG